MKKRFLLCSSIFIVLLTGCYKDKGNYDYSDINQLTLKSTADVFNVVLPDSLKIDLTVEQAKPDPAGLSFEWVIYPSTSAPLTRRVLDTTQNLRAKLTEDPGTYVLIAYAKDRKTKIEFQKRFTVNVLSAFSEGWVIVEEKTGGCDLSMVTPVDIVYRNAYSANNNGQLLPSGTFRIPEIKTNRNIQSVYFISPSEATQVNFSNFVRLLSFNDYFYSPPPVIKPQEYFMNGDAEMMINDGKPYARNLINGSTNNKLSLPPTGNYYMAPYEIYTVSSGYVLFDTLARAFSKLNLNTITLIPFAGWDGTSALDMNNVGKRMIYAELNTGNQFNAIFKNLNNDSLFAFVFNPTLAQPGINRYDGLNAPGLLTAKLFVMSRSLPHMYYASGNQIYKLDIPAKTATPVYAFPAGTEIRAMKMYRNQKNGADPANNKLIAVATQESGEGKLYYFPIAATGSFTANTYSKVFTGFGKINEIAFKSLK